MTDYVLIIGALALIAIVAAFFAGRYLLASKAAVSTTLDQSSAPELAQLLERERSLGEQVKALEGRTADLASELDARTRELNQSRQKSAADDEKITALDRALAREKEVHEAVLQNLTATLAETTQAKELLQTNFTEQAQKLASAERLEPELRGQIGRAGQHITDRDVAIKAFGEQLDAVRNSLAARESELAAAAEREAGLNRSIAERDEQLKGLQKQLKTEFENIANNVLAVTTGQLNEKSKELLAAILEPFRAKIAEFQQRVEATHTEDTAQRSALETHIKNIVQANQTIGRQAEELTKALKGDSQLRGRWGEVRLERILEDSGLVRGREFVVQGGDFNLKSEEGGSQRPDVIILLPEGRHFVIDSKVSLVDYLDYERAETDDKRGAALRGLLASVRGHIDGLAGKNYQYADAINSHDLVFMFMQSKAWPRWFWTTTNMCWNMHGSGRS